LRIFVTIASFLITGFCQLVLTPFFHTFGCIIFKYIIKKPNINGIQTIATSDYGVLSEEFSRTINEIEEGTDTKDALRHFALRTQSKSLRNALMHIIRAMKTGGNLSDIMNTIAEDVSFDLRIRIRDFAEKMNFFGVIYIFIAIVTPVFIAIIGSITNAPISVGSVAITPLAIAVIFLVGMPLILGFLIIYLKIMQPKV